MIDALVFADLRVRGAKRRKKRGAPIQCRTWRAAENVDTGGVVLRKSVDREMRFLKKPDPGDAAAFRKLMPDRFPHRFEIHPVDDILEK